MSVEAKVKEIIGEQIGVNEEDISLESSFVDDLGADSLDLVELIMTLEEEFEVDIPEEDAEKFETVGDLVGYISNRAS